MAKGRIAKLKTRIDALIAEEASLTQRVAQVVSVAPSAVDVAEWARELGTLLRAATVHPRKALFRLLVKELRVMSGEAIVPTYKIPALARPPPPEGQVVLIERCANRPNPTVRAEAIVAR